MVRGQGQVPQLEGGHDGEHAAAGGRGEAVDPQDRVQQHQGDGEHQGEAERCEYYSEARKRLFHRRSRDVGRDVHLQWRREPSQPQLGLHKLLHLQV